MLAVSIELKSENIHDAIRALQLVHAGSRHDALPNTRNGTDLTTHLYHFLSRCAAITIDDQNVDSYDLKGVSRPRTNQSSAAQRTSTENLSEQESQAHAVRLRKVRSSSGQLPSMQLSYTGGS